MIRPTSCTPDPPDEAQPIVLTRLHRILIAVVATGVVVIAGIGFAGSFAAVRDLAVRKGFGGFAPFLPIGIDAGIVVLLALDLLLTWIRIPFPLLRQTAWLLTAATIAFNAAAAWPDPLGVGMHAVIPVLFVVGVEAARHAIGRIADITADRHMEGVRLARWFLAPVPTFRLWRRMKLWELRSYDTVIAMEQDRLVYEARLRARYGRTWRRKAPVDALTPLRLARFGVPLAQTGPAGLAAADITTPTEFVADVTPFEVDVDASTGERYDAMPPLAPSGPSASPALTPAAAPGAGDGGPAALLPTPPPGGLRVVDATDAAERFPTGKNTQLAQQETEGVDAPVAGRRPHRDEDVDAMSASTGPVDAARDEAEEAMTPGDDGAGSRMTPRREETGVNGGATAPRGAIAEGVRAQLAVGELDPGVIRDRLIAALRVPISRKTVTTAMRRAQAVTPAPQPDRDRGPYL